MKALKSRILVRVDMSQKDMSGDFFTAKEFNTNHRDRHPVLCESLQDNGVLKKGDLLLVHHNFFYEGSPYQMSGDVFSLILNRQIFARLDKDGYAHSVCGNLMAERIPIPSTLELPPDYQKYYNDRVRIISAAEGYHKGQTLLCYPFADYEIIYNWKGEERRVIKVWKEDVCGRLLKKI